MIIGLAFSTYLTQSLTLVQKTINPWALEEVLVSPTGLTTFIIGSSIWGFIWSTGVVVIYLAVGVFIFGVTLSVNILGTIIVLALGIGTFIGFSMIGSGILILTKQGDPVTALITIATSLFGNVFFPPQVLPAALQAISYVFPQYYFFTCIRTYAYRLDNTDDSARPVDFNVNVRNNCSVRIRYLRVVPKNGKEKRNPLMVLIFLLG